MMTCLRWILGYMRLEIWRKIGLSADRCLCTVLRTEGLSPDVLRSGRERYRLVRLLS